MARKAQFVPLRQAPSAHTPDLWLSYRESYDTEDEALGALDNDFAAWSEKFRKTRVLVGRDPPGQAARQEGRYERGLGIVADLKDRLGDGRLIATGLRPPEIERVTLPARTWPVFSMDFVKGIIVDGPYRFVEVMIACPAGQQIVDECAEWLRAQPRINKDQFHAAARARFSPPSQDGDGGMPARQPPRASGRQCARVLPLLPAWPAGAGCCRDSC